MAYTPDTIAMIAQPIGGIVPRVFVYQTVSDSLATITGAGYFSDGKAKGMRVGDLVDVVATTGPKYARYQVTAITAAGAATVAAPTAIS
ncbi:MULTISPECIES: hypothetical protein [Brucella]|uniref:hypothetical protein n=1 Tax=Brucella TaxID=234 RepID=UPI001590A699|nr:hypothetical protein [Brucella intermedia]